MISEKGAVADLLLGGGVLSGRQVSGSVMENGVSLSLASVLLLPGHHRDMSSFSRLRPLTIVYLCLSLPKMG